MPFVRISLAKDRSATERRAIANTVHQALVTSLGVPEQDKFQVVTSHGEDLVYDPSYLGMSRTDAIVFVQVFMAQGRTVDQKKACFMALAEGLSSRHGLSKDDVFVNLVEIALENWSFGGGLAQYADIVPPHLAPSQQQAAENG